FIALKLLEESGLAFAFSCWRAAGEEIALHCEIEFLPVGTGAKAGDAIIVRYGDQNDFRVIVVDGGTEESGKAIVAHIHQYFGQSTKVDHVVVTHCDTDHASGIRTILEKLPVATLWINLPWLHAPAALPYFSDKRWTKHGLSNAIKKEYDLIGEIHDIAV